ncbi:hypothetical protein CK625_08445 [Vandammella animalimorsus]|uniref:Lipoprotein n=2 Tax=Vandammella animalimorsus TaxID=2029117 RepID=A0A2A2AGP8_9BURK|nr:hypothetical protein CK625_08445 [Vandammella animalimorsus]
MMIHKLILSATPFLVAACSVWEQPGIETWDIDSETTDHLKVRIVEIFNSRPEFKVWNPEGCYYRMDKHFYYVACKKIIEGKDFFWDDVNILLTFDKDFNLIEMN